jgi:hypothetical protein
MPPRTRRQLAQAVHDGLVDPHAADVGVMYDDPARPHRGLAWRSAIPHAAPAEPVAPAELTPVPSPPDSPILGNFSPAPEADLVVTPWMA